MRSAITRGTPGGHRRALTAALAAAAITCTSAIAACGSSSNPNFAQASAGSSLSASLVRFSAYMRSHGVPGFPDPSTTHGPNSFGIDGHNFNLPANLNSQSPAYESADTTCRHLIGGRSG